MRTFWRRTELKICSRNIIVSFHVTSVAFAVWLRCQFHVDIIVPAGMLSCSLIVRQMPPTGTSLKYLIHTASSGVSTELQRGPGSDLIISQCNINGKIYAISYKIEQYIDELMQDCDVSIANARHSCTKHLCNLRLNVRLITCCNDIMISSR